MDGVKGPRYLGIRVPLEKKMATHSSTLAWKNPMDGGAWQASAHGVTELGTTEATSLSLLQGHMDITRWSAPKSD